MKPLNQNAIEELRQMLEKEKDTLVAELKEIAVPDPRRSGEWQTIYPKFEENENGSSSSLEEEADEVEEYEIRLSAEESLHSRLLAVTRALERMEKGTYGICERCGKPIPIERLRANPAAEHHVEHAA